MVHISEARRQGFFQVLQFSPLLHRLMVSANKEMKAKINVIYTLSKLVAELYLRTKWHTAGCM